MKTVDQLLADAEKIRIETVEHNNDSERVGAALKDTIRFMKDHYLYSGNPITLSLIQQNPVANFAALATNYPNPLRDWAAMVEDEGVVYCYNGVAWASTGLKKFPEDVAVKRDIKDLTSLTDAVLPNILGTLDIYKQNGAGGTVTGSKITIAAGSTGLDSRVGVQVPKEIRNIKLAFSSTSAISCLLFAANADGSNQTNLGAPTFLFEGGKYVFEVEHLFTSKVDSRIFLFISNGSALPLIVEFELTSVLNIGIKLADGDQLKSLKSDINSIGNVYSPELSNSLAHTISVSNGSTYYEDKLTIPIGETGFDSRIAITFPSNLRKFKFEINSSKAISMAIYLSNVGYINAETINNTNWLLQIDGTYSMFVEYTIVGELEKWIFLQTLNNTQADEDIVIYYKSIKENIEDIYLKAYETSKNGVQTFETLGETIAGSAGGFSNPAGIATNKNSAVSKNGRLREITFSAHQPGLATFGIGTIDQWNKAIIEKTFTVDVISGGSQTHIINETIKEGQQVFFYMTNLIPDWGIYQQGQEDILLYVDEGVNLPLHGLGIAGFLGLNYKVVYATENFVDVYERVLSIEDNQIIQQNQISVLKSSTVVIDKITKESYKLQIANGVLSVKSTTIKKAVALGNSITRHGITPFWWGDWGMAATQRAKDWVHILQGKFQTKYATASVNALNISGLEINPLTFDFSSLDYLLQNDVDLVLLKIGENVSDTPNFAIKFDDLVDYIWLKIPTCDIIIGGMFWQNEGVNNVMKNVAEQKGLTFVSNMSLYSDPIYKSSLDTEVYGDDNQWHTISDGGTTAPGVAAHSSDIGMQAIADLFGIALGY